MCLFVPLCQKQAYHSDKRKKENERKKERKEGRKGREGRKDSREGERRQGGRKGQYYTKSSIFPVDLSPYSSLCPRELIYIKIPIPSLFYLVSTNGNPYQESLWRQENEIQYLFLKMSPCKVTLSWRYPPTESQYSIHRDTTYNFFLPSSKTYSLSSLLQTCRVMTCCLLLSSRSMNQSLLVISPSCTIVNKPSLNFLFNIRFLLRSRLITRGTFHLYNSF